MKWLCTQQGLGWTPRFYEVWLEIMRENQILKNMKRYYAFPLSGRKNFFELRNDRYVLYVLQDARDFFVEKSHKEC